MLLYIYGKLWVARSEERGKGNNIDTFQKLHSVENIDAAAIGAGKTPEGPGYHHPTAAGHDSRENGDKLRLGLL